MLDSPELPERDKAEWRLALEIRTFVGAGTETTGNTLTVITFHLLANPEKAQRLKQEVQNAQKQSSTALKYQELLQLPYLVRQQNLDSFEVLELTLAIVFSDT
jgi:cytochrome P450